jgi:hypothetical protein
LIRETNAGKGNPAGVHLQHLPMNSQDSERSPVQPDVSHLVDCVSRSIRLSVSEGTHPGMQNSSVGSLRMKTLRINHVDELGIEPIGAVVSLIVAL